MFKSLWPALVTGLLLIVTLAACEPPLAPPTSPPAVETVQVSIKDGMTLLYIPAGDFKMGSDDHRNEQPDHLVNLSAYWMDETEVTNAMYEQCAETGSCRVPARTNSYKRKEYYGHPAYADYPVIYVTWEDASTYCTWAGRHLPTEAQWEKSARGTDGRIYPWGDQVPLQGFLNFSFYVGDTSKVGSFKAGASPYGVQDLAGNVWEWVADWFDSIYYSVSPGSNPTGPPSGTDHVVRGGSWLNNQFLVRSALRIGYPSDSAFFNLGFRCALNAN